MMLEAVKVQVNKNCAKIIRHFASKMQCCHVETLVKNEWLCEKDLLIRLERVLNRINE